LFFADAVADAAVPCAGTSSPASSYFAAADDDDDDDDYDDIP